MAFSRLLREWPAAKPHSSSIGTLFEAANVGGRQRTSPGLEAARPVRATARRSLACLQCPWLRVRRGNPPACSALRQPGPRGTRSVARASFAVTVRSPCAGEPFAGILVEDAPAVKGRQKPRGQKPGSPEAASPKAGGRVKTIVHRFQVPEQLAAEWRQPKLSSRFLDTALAASPPCRSRLRRSATSRGRRSGLRVGGAANPPEIRAVATCHNPTVQPHHPGPLLQ